MGGLMVTLRKQGKAGWVCLVLTAFLLGLTPGTLQASPALSGNVPLGSYVYEYLDKLEGLGLLSAMPPGARPYSRLQVAGWVVEMEQALAKQQLSRSRLSKTFIHVKKVNVTKAFVV